MWSLGALGLCGLLLAPGITLAQAHGHGHQEGQTQKIGSYEGELVVKGADVSLYLLDQQDNKVDASKLRATAIVLAKGNELKTVELTPAGENKLAGKAEFPVDAKFRATVSLQSPSGEVGKARYSLDPSR